MIRKLLGLLIMVGAAGSFSGGAAASLHAQDMSAVDRRLYVAVVGYELNEAAAEDALESGANINLRDPAQRNDTLLILAIRNFSNPGVIRWILDKGGDPSLTNSEGRTARSIALQLSYDRLPGGREILAMLGAGGTRRAPTAGATEGRLMPEGGRGAAGIDPITGRGFAEPPRASGATGGPPPQPGVYECINQGAVRTPMTFAILDGSTYMASSGRTGRYTYNSGTGVLSLMQGGETARFQRTGPTLFRPIRPDTGELGGFTCPLNRSLNPRNPRSW